MKKKAHFSGVLLISLQVRLPFQRSFFLNKLAWLEKPMIFISDQEFLPAKPALLVALNILIILMAVLYT